MNRVLLICILLFLYSHAFSQSNLNSSTFNKVLPQTEFKMFPNPCKQNKVTINYNNKLIREVRLTNITGKLILHKKYDLPESRIQIKLNDILNGIYLVQVKTSDDKILVRKLMVSKN